MTIDGVKNFRTYILSSPKAMADRGKEGKAEIQKFEFLENKKSFLHEMKNIFQNYLQALSIDLRKTQIT